jgi:large subunit ribosomal protein L30e
MMFPETLRMDAMGSLLLLVVAAAGTFGSSGLPREEVSLQTLEGTCSHAYLLLRQIELGTACGKLFRCSTMAILDAGDSDILNDQQA